MGNSFQTQSSFITASVKLPYSFPTASILIGHYILNIDDEEAEDEMDFYIDLVQSVEDMQKYQIIGNTLTVTIIDDDEPGMIAFDREEYTAADADNEVTLKINRRKGWGHDIL